MQLPKPSGTIKSKPIIKTRMPASASMAVLRKRRTGCLNCSPESLRKSKSAFCLRSKEFGQGRKINCDGAQVHAALEDSTEVCQWALKTSQECAG